MKRPMLLLASIALLVMMPGDVFGQDLASLCAGLEQAEAGEWAEYETTSPQGSGTMRMALLAEGATPGEGPWFEVSGEANGQSSTFQVLIDEWPYEPEDITRVVMKVGDQPAMRLPDEMLAQMRSQMATPMAELSDTCEQSELVATETIETPAGTFEAHQIRPAADVEATDGEVWISTDVPFGIVRSEGQEGAMVLIDSGSGATSTITETPGEMPPMGGQGGP